ncbi:MAG: fumarylacetoacetate hydrolase family protein [Actinomycetota bacterium]|nr:fumarylacetoacetate hydrolase family protein [Actinomycetota bacterium]
MAIAAAGKGLVDLLGAAQLAGVDIGDPEENSWLLSVARLIEGGPDTWRRANEIAASQTGDPDLLVNEQDVRWLCPLDRVESIRDFLAFEDHVKRGAERRGTAVPEYWYEAPIYYKGNHRSINGPEDECPWPTYTDYLDFELELAMIVGTRGRDVSTEDAPDHIFGFTVFNDFSARDVQMKEVSAWLGPAKGKDFCNSLGPCIVTADEIGAHPDLEMICRVNGEEWGHGRSGALHWSWSDMIAHVSRSENIYPVDIYGSGTPGGCCGLDLGRKLQPGDVVELEIEKIGVLRNRIGERST